MFDRARYRADFTMQLLLFTASLALLLPIASCKKQEAAVPNATPRTFASPGEASKALADAAKSQDQEALLAIFGSGASDVIFTGDPVQDKSGFKGFVEAYQVMNRWRKMPDSSEVLLVGAENQPFPIPLKKNASGEWYFDTDAGKDEILSRRIGANEITAIAACSAVVDAQHEYFSQKHDGVKQYAQKLISDPGRKNGLYWESPPGAPQSPLGPAAANASAEGYKIQPNQHQPFHGYYFLMLTKQGPDARGGAKNYLFNGNLTRGFAIVAYPAKYGDSGIKTFIVNHDGVTFEKDLGKSTGEVASAMTEFNPDQSWTPLGQ
jgi:hypothetical protein